MRLIDKNEKIRFERFETIQKFLSIRQNMLLHVHDRSHSESSSENSSASISKQQIMAAKSEAYRQDKKEESEAKSKAEHAALLAEVVDDTSRFLFDYASINRNGSSLKADSSEVSMHQKCLDLLISIRSAKKFSNFTPSFQQEQMSCIACMQQWDKQLISRLAQVYGAGSESCFIYKVVGGVDGIALSTDGNGFARVELIVNREEIKVAISGLLTVNFESDSSRLSSVHWTTLEDRCMALPECGDLHGSPVQSHASHDSSSSKTSTLSSAMVHPSVVSLSPSLDAYKNVETGYESSGPGMNI